MKKLRDGTTDPYEPRDKVLYIPNQLLMGDKDKMVQTNNLGVVSSKNEKFVFVQYIGNTNSQATDPVDLFFLTARPDLVKIIEQNIEL